MTLRHYDDTTITDTGAGTAPIVDMGAYETIDPCTGACPGDLNYDGKVDVDDLNIVLSNWGSNVPSCTSGDATGDGVVDVDDLNLVLSNWEMPCSGIGGQQQQMMAGGFGAELISGPVLPSDLQMLGFTSWAEYREYLLSLTLSESVLHAYDLIDVHNATCGESCNDK